MEYTRSKRKRHFTAPQYLILWTLAAAAIYYFSAAYWALTAAALLWIVYAAWAKLELLRYPKIGGRIKYGSLRCFRRRFRGVTREKKRIDKMEGIAFERYVTDLLWRNGYRARETQASGDFGVDIVMCRAGEKYAVQCKRYKKNVGIHAVQEIAAGKRFYGCDHGVVITNAKFTSAAKTLAESEEVLLWDEAVLMDMIENVSSKQSFEGE